jgi:hypothetical protein
MRVEVTCPFCGEGGTVEVPEDEEGEEQEFVQDCAVCCRPWRVRIRVRRGGAEVSISGDD